MNVEKSQTNSEKAQLSANIQELQAQLKVITAERDALKGSSGTDSSDGLRAMTQELERLRNEKAVVEEALQQEKRQKPPVPVDTSDKDAQIARYLWHCTWLIWLTFS